MSTSIATLPFDLVHAIAILLDVRSYINLARTNKRLFTLLKDENAARQCLEVSDSPWLSKVSNEASAIYRTIMMPSKLCSGESTAVPLRLSPCFTTGEKPSGPVRHIRHIR
jgi:hypothetical protein